MPERKQLVLVPKAQPPSEDARWTLAPEVSVPVGRTDQRRAVVHWTPCGKRKVKSRRACAAPERPR